MIIVILQTTCLVFHSSNIFHLLMIRNGIKWQKKSIWKKIFPKNVIIKLHKKLLRSYRKKWRTSHNKTPAVQKCANFEFFSEVPERNDAYTILKL